MSDNKPVEVLITIPLQESLIDRIREEIPQINLTIKPEDQFEDITDAEWQQTEILYTETLLPPNPDLTSNLKWVQLHLSGADFLQDSYMLDMQEIIMTTLSGANASKAAEYVILAMLSMAGRLFDVYHHQRDAVWMTDEEVNSLEIRELRGSTVGIVGYGSIGRETARLLHSFGMTILAAKRDVKAPHDSGYIPPGRGDPQGDYFHRLYPIQALRSMLKECDYVVITVPLTPETRNLIGVEEMGVMKPSAYLINVSRGAVVDEEALINALNHSQIAGAALDVSAIEPLPSENPLWQMPNVLISPHIADQSISYDVHSVELFLENCKRYLSAEPLLNEFDQKIGY